MTDTATPTPEVETPDSATNLGELLGRRHQPTRAHDPHQEVGAESTHEDDEDDDVQPPAAPAAPAAAAPPPNGRAQPAPAPAAAAGEPDPADDPRAPKWYRDQMKAQRRENARLRQQIEGGVPGRQPPPQPQQQPRPQAPALPNPAEDPQGYHEAIVAQHNASLANMRLELKLEGSADRLIERHGEDMLEDVRDWLISKAGQDGSNPMESWAMAQRDPWSAAYQQMQRERLAEEIGDDPEAYKKRLREEWERERAQQAGDPGPAPAAQPAAPTMRRPPPPAPASTARSAQQPRDGRGQFTGPAPLRLRNNF